MGRDGDAAGNSFGQVRAVADAILYEGYLLYPYRKSSGKNRVRWQFGILAPRAWAERDGPVAEGIAGSVESWQQQTECLFEASSTVDNPTVYVGIRYLQFQSKLIERRDADGQYIAVESIDIDGTSYLSFDEAVAQESVVTAELSTLLRAEQAFEVGVLGGEEIEYLGDGAARVVRRRLPVAATTSLHLEPLDATPNTYRLRVRTENTASAARADSPRGEALRYSLIATHALLGGEGIEYASLIDPPSWAAPHVPGCRNVHTFPVLAGAEAAESPNSGDTLLSSPILLYDNPQIAPESPGDLHDSAEIDEILTLRTLTLTDEEQREARATDPRAAQILDRAQDMPDEVMARLHGVVRSLQPSNDTDTSEGGV